MDDITSLHPSEDEFEGFSDEENQPPPPPPPPTKMKSVVSVIAGSRGKAPIRGRAKIKSSKTPKTKPKPSGNVQRLGSSDPPGPSTSPCSSNVLDFSKLSPEDIAGLRSALGIEFPEYYEEPMYGAQSGGNLRVTIDSKDIESDDNDNPSAGLFKIPKLNDNTDMYSAFGDTNSAFSDDEYNWDLPKMKTPERGLPISESLARLINTACTQLCDTDQLMSKYPVPVNCDKATPPLVNQEVWRFMDKKGHLGDRTLVDIQNLVSATFGPICSLVGLHKKNKTMTKDVKGIFSDIITGLGQVQYNISLRRRYQIRPYLKKKYSPLCNMTMPITSKLFGDDISKEVKSCDNISFLGKDPFYQSTFRGATRSRGRFRGRRGYGNVGYIPQNYNSNQNSGYQGYRQHPYPTRGFPTRGAGQFGGRPRAPRRRGTATATSASGSRDPNEEE